MQKMTTAAIRKEFINFFVQNGHKEIASANLVPTADDSLLFVNAGMVPFKPYFLGEQQPPAKKIVTSQRCLRVGGKHNDLDNVGYTARHHTLFEMLGNFSIGAYGKREAMQYAWDFLTKVLKIPVSRLWVTVYTEDDESAQLWEKHIGVDKERILRCGVKDNFWSMGDTGPCGPCSEIFYDHGPEVEGGLPGSANEDGDRYVEIWNLVFMQYERDASGDMSPLPKPCIDTGMGLERISAVMQAVHSNYDTDVFVQIGQAIQSLPATKPISSVASAVISDHLRAIVWLIHNQVYPGNEGRAYVLRRVIRRALRYAYNSGMDLPCLYNLVKVVIATYPEEKTLAAEQENITTTLRTEELAFASTIKQGMQLFEQLLLQTQQGKGSKNQDNLVSGEEAFKLYDTYGFPLDLVMDLAKEHGYQVDTKGFDQAMAAQRARSRQHQNFKDKQAQTWAKGLVSEFCGYQGLSAQSEIIYIHKLPTNGDELDGANMQIVLAKTPFYPEAGGQVGDGGLIATETGVFKVTDTQKIATAIVHTGHLIKGSIDVGQQADAQVDAERSRTAQNHSATHLLHAALVQVLGSHVQQKGSLVNAEKLRFDFSHPQPVTAEEMVQIEALVNEQISKNHWVETALMDYNQAKSEGAMALFSEKYADEVRVLTMGAFSKELCGGIHVNRTGDIGAFVITSEAGIAGGVRRIEALTDANAIQYWQNMRTQLNTIAQTLKTKPAELALKVEQDQQSLKQQVKQIEQQQKNLLSYQAKTWLKQAITEKNTTILVQKLDSDDAKALRWAIDSCLQQSNEVIALLYTKPQDGRCSIAVGVSKRLCKQQSAATIMQALGRELAIKGGGKASFAQGVAKLSPQQEHTLAQQLLLSLRECL